MYLKFIFDELLIVPKGEVMRTVGMEKRTDGRHCRIKSALDNWLSVGAKERAKRCISGFEPKCKEE